MKVTVPVGVPAVPVTVAVKVTDSPNTDGLADEESAVLVGAACPVKARLFNSTLTVLVI